MKIVNNEVFKQNRTQKKIKFLRLSGVLERSNNNRGKSVRTLGRLVVQKNFFECDAVQNTRDWSVHILNMYINRCLLCLLYYCSTTVVAFVHFCAYLLVDAFVHFLGSCL